MEPIVAVMLILGCDHSMMVCRQTSEPAPQYASVEACEADMNLAMRFVDQPMAVAECIEVPGLKDGQKIMIDWRLDATRKLFAETRLRDSGPMTAEVATVTAAGGV